MKKNKVVKIKVVAIVPSFDFKIFCEDHIKFQKAKDFLPVDTFKFVLPRFGVDFFNNQSERSEND